MPPTSEAMLLLRNSHIHSREPQNTVISPASENNLNSSTSFGQIALTLHVTHLNPSPKGKYPLKATCPASDCFEDPLPDNKLMFLLQMYTLCANMFL